MGEVTCILSAVDQGPLAATVWTSPIPKARKTCWRWTGPCNRRP